MDKKDTPWLELFDGTSIMLREQSDTKVRLVLHRLRLQGAWRRAPLLVWDRDRQQMGGMQLENLSEKYNIAQLEENCRKRFPRITGMDASIIFETWGFKVRQLKPRSDFGTVWLLFSRNSTHYSVMWSSYLQRLADNAPSRALDAVVDLREAYQKLRELFPNEGYAYADPEVREIFLGQPQSPDGVSPVSHVSEA